MRRDLVSYSIKAGDKVRVVGRCMATGKPCVTMC